MEENVRLAYLYDFYGELLNEGQRELFSTFVFQDLSLQEMADELGISRQAVHDRIHRCIRAMEEYEAKLHLLKKYQKIEGFAEEIKIEIDKIECAFRDKVIQNQDNISIERKNDFVSVGQKSETEKLISTEKRTDSENINKLISTDGNGIKDKISKPIPADGDRAEKSNSDNKKIEIKEEISNFQESKTKIIHLLHEITEVL